MRARTDLGLTLAACLIVNGLTPGVGQGSVRARASGTQYYMSKKKANEAKGAETGTKAAPFRTFKKAIAVLDPGDTLNIAGGVYHQQLDVTGRHGTAADPPTETPAHPITTRALPGARVYIDGGGKRLKRFRDLPSTAWLPASEVGPPDPEELDDEYVSSQQFPGAVVNRGAFLGTSRYTRLITYGRLEDLRSQRQTFDRTFGSDPKDGPTDVVTGKGEDPHGYPWVYMGPGLWFNEQTHRVHIRLAHTTNDIPGLPDYEGETDPRKLRLALAARSTLPLRVRGSEHVRLEHLTIRYGGDETAHVENVDHVRFDHVRFLASTIGVRMEHAKHTVFHDCVFSGGLPTWYFRSDHKAEYEFRVNGHTESNSLGKDTSEVLLRGNRTNRDTYVDHSEFVDGHDLYLSGRNVDFGWNWVHNLQDDALLFDAVPTFNAKVHHNVITKVVSAISFGGIRRGGRQRIYRNVIDLRERIAGRPSQKGSHKELRWRYGNLYKGNDPDGLWDLFQNTFLVSNQHGPASFIHFRSKSPYLHRTFNNVFLAVNSDEHTDKPITLVPPDGLPRAMDGNAYYRLDMKTSEPFRRLSEPRGWTIDELRDATDFELQGLDQVPLFKSLGADGAVRPTDDLSLQSDSPARNHGVILRPRLRKLDLSAPPQGRPDIGAFQGEDDELRVGVDGRRSPTSR